MWRDILDSYMDVHLPPLIRIEKIWTAVFILRIWRQHVKLQKKRVTNDRFLTANCYSCIELNALSLVQCMLYLKEHDLPNLFLPHHYNSQVCESIFRQIRSFTSTYSTVANCSIKEILSRISKIQLQNKIVHSSATRFFYPKSNLQKSTSNIAYDLPTKSEIIKSIIACKTNAIKIACRFGFKIKNESSLNFCEIPKLVSRKKKQKIKAKTNIKNILHGLLRINDLKNANLINFVKKHPNPDEKSPFVKLHDSKVVKKTSLCWLFRNDYSKLSSDRVRRVMALEENNNVNLQQKNVQKQPKIKFSICQYKQMKTRILRK